MYNRMVVLVTGPLIMNYSPHRDGTELAAYHRNNSRVLVVGNPLEIRFPGSGSHNPTTVCIDNGTELAHVALRQPWEIGRCHGK